jgi:hypothetical protein
MQSEGNFMKVIRNTLITTTLLLVSWCAIADDPDLIANDLDLFWAEVSRTVNEGAFEGYKATYHPDAILVSGLNGTSYPITKAFEGWLAGFEDTRSGAMSASVEFRFTTRWHDETTAHETGIFRYVSAFPNGSTFEQLIHFEGLLVNKGGWKMMMELQRSLASVEEWEALQ